MNPNNFNAYGWIIVCVLLCLPIFVVKLSMNTYLPVGWIGGYGGGGCNVKRHEKKDSHEKPINK